MTTKQSSLQPQPQPPERLIHPNNSNDKEIPLISSKPRQPEQPATSNNSKDNEVPSTSLKPHPQAQPPAQPIRQHNAKEEQVPLISLKPQPSIPPVKSNDSKDKEILPISLKPYTRPPEQPIQQNNSKDKEVPLISPKPNPQPQPPEQPIPNDSKVQAMSLISPKQHPQASEQPIQQNDSENKDKKISLISQKPHQQPPPEKPIQQNISKNKDKKVSIIPPPEPEQYQYHPSTTAATITTDKTILNKYQLGRFLGSGRFAKVYYARSLETNKSVAIKVIDKLKTEPSVYPRIVGEIIAMSKLDHPNILHIHEVMASKQKIYLVMELAKGGDLSTKLTRRPDHRFPEPLARRYFQQLVSALCYCHENGVAHRDVKPQNILLDEEGNIKVSDFGLSAIVEGPMDSAHLLETACGTPAFAAPEIVGRTGHSKYDGSKADAWSCGVMLFVMLTGHLPFDDGNLILMYRKMIKKEFRFSSWVPKPARGLITRLLDPNPETRMSVDEIMKDPWFKNHGMLYPRSISLGDLASLAEKKPERKSTRMERTISMNAFEIISTSPALDLSGLFEVGGFKGKTRSSSKGSLKGMVETVVEEE